MPQKNMLTPQDLKLIEELFDRKFDERFDDAFDKRFEKQAKDIVEQVYLMIEPMHEDIRIMKKQLEMHTKAHKVFRSDIAFAHSRIDHTEDILSNKLRDMYK